MKHFILTLSLLALLAAGLVACTPPATPTQAPPTQPPPTAEPTPVAEPTAASIANPASVNCTKQGGTLTIEKRGDGGEYGVCTFEDNQQCEEWALMRGACPVGGVKVTGYVTDAGRYCAITGGTYAVTGNSGASNETGTCTLPDGGQCDADAYYNGTCDASTAVQPTPAAGEAALTPLDAKSCAAMADDMAKTLKVKVTESEAPITDYAGGDTGTGCQATATGAGEQFSSPDAVVKELGSMLEAQGWQEDMNLAAGGPTGTASGYRKDTQMCLASAQWQPDASANCPQDQPISACQVTPSQQLYTVTLNCAQSAPAPATGTGMANPASENCTKQGGTLTIEKRGDGGEYGVCTFEDNQQCEEWALLRGECRVGGVKVTGYVTDAGRYCAITGGTYAITANSGKANEQGTCTLPGDGQCDADAYYNGTCDASTAAATPASADASAPASADASAPITATQVITYTPAIPTGEPQEGSCWTSSLAVWRPNAYRCTVGNQIYDPCFAEGDSVICGADPTTEETGFVLKLTQPLPTPETPQDAAAHAWLVELADGTVCGFATGATYAVGGDRANYLCPSSDPKQQVALVGDLQPGKVWMAKRAVTTGNMPDLKVVESAEAPLRTVWQ